ncbi:MAG TPA: non-homologous end-joining DNA ligase [Gemmatimonadaceae bacterium]|nr:non-homologous end-joining DNA ligase [Gemmatimonadaceae bacterium]
MEVTIRGRTVRLTNLDKVFWPSLGLTKGDLIRYYGDVASVLVPYITGRAMVMKRYPNGITGKMFFMKRTPSPRPDWLVTCCIRHGSGNEIDFPVIDDEAALMWVINLGCIDLNPWYSTCDDVHKPDVLHFDLDPTPGATFEHVRQAALLVRDGLQGLGMKCVAKTTGSRGVHVYVPIVRGPDQKEVWTFAKRFAVSMAKLEPGLLTSEYRVAHRPEKHALVDYNQNAWGRTLASVYSVRPTEGATVSTPVTWEELANGVSIQDFTVMNVPARVKAVGDLWQPIRERQGRFDLKSVL